jgi:hypothetical protein
MPIRDKNGRAPIAVQGSTLVVQLPSHQSLAPGHDLLHKYDSEFDHAQSRMGSGMVCRACHILVI